ncbi:phage regulatory CII family protein [Paraburkholderia sp. J41]|uniref:phage regulatory CII family protein n=1 Tax=Paraburkholderia sp. J41 TaxID=2805433 RepID=UPI002AC31FCB|nr:phage regulatory CII family protein [Paraburkholderia sp. J41]
MTCRYSEAEWLDVLYTSVRNTQGGVADAAAFLTNRRGRNIGTESLRLRLRGQGENRLSMEMFELLTEWMEEKRVPHYRDALIALNERFGLNATPADATSPGNTTNEIALQTLDLARHTGIVAEQVQAALEDGVVTNQEAADIEAAARGSKRMLDRLMATVRRVNKQHAR